MTTRREAKLPRRTCDNVDRIKKETTSCSHDDGEHAIELPFDVITIIFKNLGVRDLCSAAIVCRSWNEAAELEKKLRIPGAHFEDFSDTWMDTHQAIDKCGSKPMLSIMFTRKFDDQHPAMNESADCPCKDLPSGCPSIIVGNHGVINDRTELENSPEKAAWLLFPYDKNVTIDIVGVPVSNDKTHAKMKIVRQMQKQWEKLLTLEKRPKSFILLCSEDENETSAAVRKRLPRNLDYTLSGGAAWNLALCSKDKSGEMCRRSMGRIGIMISGDSVRSWSIVVGKNCRTSSKVEEKLKLLKGRVVLRKHTVGFMFACSGRGGTMFGEQNVESNIFKKLFPRVPLIGSFGDGEYGNSIDNTTAWRVIHQFTTVFMIVTYG